eukprot:TRINITY_DN2530_c0_g1_i4.p1 TRINITY_DN2530_c0_g1~~TRINITY_DN2530_c0_g1_i4.p1  ORF type:complete len:145 (+),score=12.52 TRINITY_DN2530_c0_g1_i4:174-608(+)
MSKDESDLRQVLKGVPELSPDDVEDIVYNARQKRRANDHIERTYASSWCRSEYFILQRCCNKFKINPVQVSERSRNGPCVSEEQSYLRCFYDNSTNIFLSFKDECAMEEKQLMACSETKSDCIKQTWDFQGCLAVKYLAQNSKR